MSHRLSLLILSSLLLAHALPAPALTIHRCTGSDGVVAFQDRPCTAHQQSRVMVLRKDITAAATRTTGTAATADGATTAAAAADRRGGPARPRAAAKSPAAAKTRSAARAPARHRRSTVVTGIAGVAASSWECRAGNGEIFYQHGPCPAAVIGSVEQRTAATRGRRRSDAQTMPVAGRPIARTEACRRIHAASASDRAGHERDEDVSTYERNLGRDPCR